MRKPYETDKEFYKLAMKLFIKSGHTNNVSPLLINHSPKQFAYIDNEDTVSLTKDQRDLLECCQNVSFLFEQGDELFNKKTHQRIGFYSLDLLCAEHEKSQIAAAMNSLIYIITGNDATILLCRYENRIIFSFVGYELGCILSDWFSEELDFDKLVGQLHIVNVSLNSAKEYFFDLAYNMAREYYVYPLRNELANYIMLPINYFSDNVFETITREDISKIINDSLDTYRNKYGEDYVEIGQYDPPINTKTVDDFDLFLLDILNEDNEVDPEIDIKKDFAEKKIREEDKGHANEHDINDIDPEIFEDPTLMAKWIEKNYNAEEHDERKDYVAERDENSKASNVKAFFENAGLEVVDKRQKGGCLWIVGDKESIGEYVDKAIEKYHITGGYGSGKATGYRVGWYTKTEK